MAIWDDPTAHVRVFLRDETNTRVNVNGDTASIDGSAMVSAVAEIAGRWSVAVPVRFGDVNYDLLAIPARPPHDPCHLVKHEVTAYCHCSASASTFGNWSSTIGGAV